jgi:hypothetical protein
MNESLKVTRKFHVARRQHGRKQLHDGVASDVPAGRVPRIARLMALAIRCEKRNRSRVEELIGCDFIIFATVRAWIVRTSRSKS